MRDGDKGLLDKTHSLKKMEGKIVVLGNHKYMMDNYSV